MKRLIAIFFLLGCLSNKTYSQKYSFKKIVFSGQSAKVSGSVEINDSLFIINTEGTISNLKVKKILDEQTSKQFKLIVPEGSNTEMRLTLNSTSKLNEFLLLTETTDHFTNSMTSITYFLNTVDD
jgi:hypothetical protein